MKNVYSTVLQARNHLSSNTVVNMTWPLYDNSILTVEKPTWIHPQVIYKHLLYFLIMCHIPNNLKGSRVEVEETVVKEEVVWQWMNNGSDMTKTETMVFTFTSVWLLLRTFMKFCCVVANWHFKRRANEHI